MNSINCVLPQEMIDEILKLTRLMGPPDDPVHRKAFTEMNEEFVKRFTPWSEEEEYYYGTLRWRENRWLVSWPDPIWYKDWISYIDERGRILHIPQTEDGWGGVWQEL